MMLKSLEFLALVALTEANREIPCTQTITFGCDGECYEKGTNEKCEYGDSVTNSPCTCKAECQCLEDNNCHGRNGGSCYVPSKSSCNKYLPGDSKITLFKSTEACGGCVCLTGSFCHSPRHAPEDGSCYVAPNSTCKDKYNPGNDITRWKSKEPCKSSTGSYWSFCTDDDDCVRNFECVKKFCRPIMPRKAPELGPNTTTEIEEPPEHTAPFNPENCKCKSGKGCRGSKQRSWCYVDDDSGCPDVKTFLKSESKYSKAVACGPPCTKKGQDNCYCGLTYCNPGYSCNDPQNKDSTCSKVTGVDIPDSAELAPEPEEPPPAVDCDSLSSFFGDNKEACENTGVCEWKAGYFFGGNCVPGRTCVVVPKGCNECLPDSEGKAYSCSTNTSQKCGRSADVKKCIDSHKKATDGEFNANHPILYVPGFLSSSLFVEQVGQGDGCAGTYDKGDKVYPPTIGLSFLFKRSCFAKVMTLQDNDGPNGWKLRTKPGETDFAPEMLKRYLAAVGYTDGENFQLLTIDWRLKPDQMQARDGLFTKTKAKIEDMYRKAGNKPVMILTHSYGGITMHSMFEHLVRNGQANWVKRYIHHFAAVAAPSLGSHAIIQNNHALRLGLPGAFLETKRSWTGAYTFFPSGGTEVWGMKPVVTLKESKRATTGKELNVNQYNDEMEKELGHPIGFRRGADDPEQHKMWGDESPIYDMLEHPLPPVKRMTCLMGSGLDTIDHVTMYRKKNNGNIFDYGTTFLDSDSKEGLDGDEYVSTRSAGYLCHLYRKNRGKFLSNSETQVSVKEYRYNRRTRNDDFHGVSHTTIMKNEKLIIDIIRMASSNSLDQGVEDISSQTKQMFDEIDTRSKEMSES